MRTVSSMPKIFAAIVVVLFIAAGSWIFLSMKSESSLSNTTSTVSSLSNTTSTISSNAISPTNTSAAVALCGTAARIIIIDGSSYCAADISNDIVVGAPGYSYFINGSITFIGVKFQTMCPSYYHGCPNSSTATITVSAGAMGFNMTFPDKTVETAGAVIGDSQKVLILSNHIAPKAGMQIEYISGLYASGASTSNYRVLLLVQTPPG